MITKQKIETLIEDHNVKSISLCKYIQNKKKDCFIDFELMNGKKLQEPISEEIFDTYHVPLVKGNNMYTKTLK